MLEAKGLHAAYGETKVLHGIDFVVRKGGVTALLGANGAGKTTTLRAICGLVRISGELTLDGKRIDGMATEDIVRLGVAHVPEGRGTFMELTVEENMRLGAYSRPAREATDDFEKMFGNINLGFAVDKIYGVWNPVAILGAFFLGMIVSLLASWFPARHAAKVDPATSLRKI